MPEEFNNGQGVEQKSTQRLGRGAEQTGPVTAADLKDQVRDDLGTIKEAVTNSASSAMGKVTDQTNFAARQVGGVATVLQKVGAELESGDQPQVGRYAKQIGESVQAIAGKMEGRDLGEIAGMAEDFGRKQPIAFLGVAALAGLAASRFLTASAKRSAGQSSSSTPSSAKSSSPEPGGLLPTNGGSTMANPNETAPLSELIGGLVSDVSGLMRKEINLAKTEASEKVAKALTGVEGMVVGLVLAIGAVGVLLSALVSGVAVLFVQYGMSQVAANALSALIVGVVIVGIAWLFISRGIANLRAASFTLDRTTTSLRRDVDVVKEKI